MKKGYESPAIYVERFAANEYIAGCTEYIVTGCGGHGKYTVTLPTENTVLQPGRSYGALFTGLPNGVSPYYMGNDEWLLTGTINNDGYHKNGEVDPVGCYQCADEWGNYASTDHTLCEDENHKEFLKRYGLAMNTPHHHMSMKKNAS